MPFGLHRTATPFQWVMDKVLVPVRICAVAYIDDILVFSPSWEQHLQHFRRAFTALQAEK